MESPRVWIIQTPSTRSQVWREALASACQARGWDFYAHERGQSVPTVNPDRPLLVVSWLDQTEEVPVTHRAVQLSPPAMVFSIVKERENLSDNEANYEASLRLATAWSWKESGAFCFHFDDELIDLPELGKVRSGMRGKGSCNDTSCDVHALNLFEYRGLDQVEGAKWEAELFSYPDAIINSKQGVCLDLAGRRRLLFNGPNIFLPPGMWRFTAQMTINPPGNTELLVEWGHGYDVSDYTAPITKPGRYEISLEKKWLDIHPADFRVSLMIPALDGRFEFHGGLLSRV